MSGQEMLAFLTDHRRFESAYEEQKEPLIIDADGELDIHVGRSEPYASLHHDHLLACVLEGGVSLEQPVRSTRRTFPLRDLVRSALLNFRVDQGEYEWTTMLAAYCLGQQPVWRNDQGRRISFDLLARRLLRSADRLGVCAGTHRLYAMAVLLRLQQGRTVLSEPMRRRLWGHLKGVSRRLAAAQRADGCWTRRWWEGAAARTDTGTLADNVLATGHHLEWMSIAPESLLPPRTNLIRAGQWLVHAVGRSSDELIRQRYTFYSHVIGALANWRSVRPYSFYRSYPLGRLAQTRAVAR